MSDQATEATRNPEDYVKRAPTPSEAIAQAGAVGTGTSTLGLFALYISQCIDAHRLIAPSTEMIIVLLGLVLPVATIVWSVGNAKLKKWAAGEGVQTAILVLITAGMLSACASKPITRDGSLKATCAAISTGDAAFQAFATAVPGVIDANGMDTEGAIVSAFYTRGQDGTLTAIGVCKPPYTGDLQAAIDSAIAASIKVTALLAHWQS